MHEVVTLTRGSIGLPILGGEAIRRVLRRSEIRIAAWISAGDATGRFPEHRLADTAWGRASRFATRVATEPCGGSYTLNWILRTPLDFLAYMRVARSLPALRLSLHESTSQLCDIVRSTSSLAILGREPVAVLEVPSDGISYLRGRKRQALRTNRTKALELGCSVDVVGTGTARLEINRVLSHIMGQSDHAHAQDGAWPVGLSSDHIGVVGRDATGRPIVLAVARRFGSVAVLEMFLRFYIEDVASVCRSLVHVELVREVAAQGVKTLIVGGALRLEPGLQYLQVLQGFQPMHLKFANEARAVALPQAEPLVTEVL